MNDDFSNAGDIIKSLFDKIMPEEATVYTGLFSGWEELVGPEISMHVVLRDVQNESLILEADHPGWIQRMRMQQEGILAEMHSRYPELGIRRLKISLGDGKKILSKTEKPQPSESIVEKREYILEKTPSVASPEDRPEEDRKFFELLDKMRKHGDS